MSKKDSNEKKKPEDDEFGKISTKQDLKEFLLNIRDKMTEGVAPPIFVASAMNDFMNLDGIYKLLNKENKEIARDIWLRLVQSGLQLKTPQLLFGGEEDLVL